MEGSRKFLHERSSLILLHWVPRIGKRYGTMLVCTSESDSRTVFILETR